MSIQEILTLKQRIAKLEDALQQFVHVIHVEMEWEDDERWYECPACGAIAAIGDTMFIHSGDCALINAQIVLKEGV